MANGTGTNGHIQGLDLQDGWAIIKDPGFGNRTEYIARVGRWVGIKRARVEADTAEATERFENLKLINESLEETRTSLRAERDTLNQRLNFTTEIFKGSDIDKLIEYAQTALNSQSTDKTPTPPFPYNYIKETLERITIPIIQNGGYLGAEICLRTGHELFRSGLFPEARVAYELVRKHHKIDLSLSLSAEMGLLAMKEARKEIPSLDETILGPEIDATFERFLKEDPTLTIGKYVKETLSSATQGGVKNQTSPAAFFVRASYQLRNNKQWDDSTAQLMKEALTQDSNLVDTALKLAHHYHNNFKPNKEIAQGIMSVIYVSSEKTSSDLKIRIGLEGYSIYETELSGLIDQMREQKGDYQQLKQSRMQLTELVKANPIHAQPLYHATVALQLQKEWDLAEEIGIALASATNEPKYWRLIGDVVSQSPTKDKPARASWAQQCYSKCVK